MTGARRRPDRSYFHTPRRRPERHDDHGGRSSWGVVRGLGVVLPRPAQARLYLVNIAKCRTVHATRSRAVVRCFVRHVCAFLASAFFLVFSFRLERSRLGGVRTSLRCRTVLSGTGSLTSLQVLSY